MQFALTYASGAYDTRTKMMGRQSAGLGFLRAALDAKPERIWCYAATRTHAEIFARDVQTLSPSPPELRFIPWDQPARLAPVGTLYRPDPGLLDGTWRRQSHSGARAYSLCSVTHTLSSHAAMSSIAAILAAPVYPWDALICTSRVARDVVRHVLENETEQLRTHLGATTFSLPQLPVIPLGVRAADFTFTSEQRAEARARIGLTNEDVVALFAGRLTFHGKGHPLPMFVGLEEAARKTGKAISLILFGQFNNAAIEEIFRKEAAFFAPSIRFIVLDGKKEEDRIAAWAGADLFTSLSDNIQETFGLTPIEAMAAGLPCVVSDWDGYKDTVRDGIDGFRVPTIMLATNLGGDLADRYDVGIDEYDLYIGQASLFTSVDVSAAASAYTKLVADPELRKRMGEAGRQRSNETYEWSVIFRRYMSLWEELAEHRRSYPKISGELNCIRRPDRPDPFNLFQTFATRHLDISSKLCLRSSINTDDVTSYLKLGSVSYARVLPSSDLLKRVVANLAEHKLRDYVEVLTNLHDVPRWQADRAVLFLAKMGIVHISQP